MNNFNNHLKDLKSLVEKLNDKNLYDKINRVCELTYNCVQNSKTLFFAGNGGSASDSNHLAAEYVIKFNKIRNPIKAISLASNISNITACGNDFGFDYIFERQIRALANTNDLLFIYSTSGKSKNIIQLLSAANDCSLKIVSFTGLNADTIFSKLSHEHIEIPSINTARIQEIYMFISHCICDYVDELLT